MEHPASNSEKRDTTYDQLNIEIPEDFPAEGSQLTRPRPSSTARAGPTQTRAQPLLVRDHLLRARAREIYMHHAHKTCGPGHVSAHQAHRDQGRALAAQSVERAQERRALRRRDHRLVGGLHARGSGSQVELASSAPKGGQGCEPAQPRDRWERADRVEEVHALLRRGAPHRAAQARQLSPDGGAARGVRGREHHLRGGHRGPNLHGRG